MSGFVCFLAGALRVLTGLACFTGDALSLTKTCVTGFSSTDSINQLMHIVGKHIPSDGVGVGVRLISDSILSSRSTDFLVFLVLRLGLFCRTGSSLNALILGGVTAPVAISSSGCS